MHETAILWFRKDLRLADNPALVTALEAARTVVPVVVEPPAYAPGEAAGVWRTHSLAALDAQLERLGSRLWVLDGPAEDALPALARETGATLVSFNRVWDPASLAEESRVERALRDARVAQAAAESAYLVAPGSLATRAGTPYRVFTPFHRAWQRAVRAEAPQGAPTRVPALPRAPRGARRPAPPGADAALHAMWEPGEAGAARRLERFVGGGALAAYADARDVPALEGTSELSPHLAAGELSPRQVLWAVSRSDDGDTDGAREFVRQLAWRDFAAHVLDASPTMLDTPLRPEFAQFAWRDDPGALERWREGRTGYPLVDAGMRQLATTGWMHNRVRMVAASLLTKDLLIPWQIGERHFRDELVDYDPAQNAFNWQWVAGSGADASPYFRIMNPVTQARRFDPHGSYVRAWVPEIAALPDRWIHTPWEASREVWEAAGLRGTEYPVPVVEHALGRARALEAYASSRATSV